jgi:L-asparaginase
MEDNIVLIKLFPGINETTIDCMLNRPGLKGAILETYGAGNCTTEKWFTNALDRAIGKGIHIINVTQCSGGSVLMGQYETSMKLKEIGVISGKDITSEAAVCKLMHLLANDLDSNELRSDFESSLRGEMS